MRCPTCPESLLVMTDRSGIEIDYCPTCRGVWLDRGELDKIIERSAAALPSPTPSPMPAPAAAPNSSLPRPADYDFDRDSDRRPRRRDDDDYFFDDDSDRRPHPHGKKRSKKSMLGELFDF